MHSSFSISFKNLNSFSIYSFNIKSMIKIIKINLNQLLKKRMKKTMRNVKEKLKMKKQKNVVKIVNK